MHCFAPFELLDGAREGPQHDVDMYIQKSRLDVGSGLCRVKIANILIVLSELRPGTGALVQCQWRTQVHAREHLLSTQHLSERRDLLLSGIYASMYTLVASGT